MSKKGYIFVYGTLKVGGHFAKQFDKNRLSSVPATAKGVMYEASGWYPAVIFGGDDDVIGELHEYADIEWVLQELDYIEGSSKYGNKHDLYNRHMVVITLESGEEVEAHTYEYNRSVENLKVCENGIWDIHAERSASTP
jgi:gamma-glutamylcyclotransferase (GGCT)/AIG2-like uncharacterized protein YtfP